MKKLLFLLAVFIFGFASCSKDDSITDEGVVINGVRWATRNVAAPGTFAATPEDAGMFFQWNRRTGISATTPGAGVAFPNWNATQAGGSTWARANDPCPQGWRVPTMAELNALHAAGSEWTNRKGVYGRYFGTGQNRIFLPASGGRNATTGALNSVGTWGIFWSRIECDGARTLSFSRGVVLELSGMRSIGGSVRCVAE